MNRKVVVWSIIVSLGGFLFGLDTAVISGAEQAIQRTWHLSNALLGLAVATALWGTVVGAMFGGVPADRWGRRATLFWVGVLYLVSALGSALAPDVHTFMLFRFIGGLAIGASSVAAPMYISEIAPPDSRGRLVATFQFNIVLGILIAYLSNYLIGAVQPEAWRWMLGVVAIPSLVFVLLIHTVPRSPRWLVVKRGNEAEARAVLEMISPGTVEESLAAIRSQARDRSGSRSFWSGTFQFPIMLAFLFAFFNQVSGINAIIYYAPRIFEMTGLGQSAALLSSAGIGLVNLVFTMAGISLIDRFGRRSLMFLGSLGLVGTLGLVAHAFSSGSFGGVPFYLFAFIAFFAISQGTVIWVFISEIFPTDVRACGQSFGSFTHWIFAALIANLFPMAAGRFGGGPIFAFFTAMMVLQLLYVWRMMPETRGRSLEELEDVLTARPEPAASPAPAVLPV